MKIKEVERTNEVTSMLQIIKNIETYKENSENGLVILLNSAWGTGKTTFLKQLEKSIKDNSELELFCNYKAYEYDCYDNAYIPLFASIAEKIKLDNSKLTNIAKSTAIGLLISLESVGMAIINKSTGIDIKAIKEDIQESSEKLNTNFIKDFEDFKKNKEYIKEQMSEKCSDKTQVFIIDELDRCKPSFAMETLEIVKHFFDVPNCVFIIAVDKLQLEQSAKTIYGAIDGEKYFSKLFDYQFNLLPITIRDAVDFEDSSDNVTFVNYASEVFNILNISLRDSKKILNDLLKRDKNWGIRKKLFMLFFFILKYTDLVFYNAILNGELKKYIDLIDNTYDPNLERYDRLFKHNMGSGYTYGELLELMSTKLDLELNKIEYETRGHTSTFRYGNHVTNDVIEALRDHIPNVDYTLSTKELVKRIVG